MVNRVVNDESWPAAIQIEPIHDRIEQNKTKEKVGREITPETRIIQSLPPSGDHCTIPISKQIHLAKVKILQQFNNLKKTIIKQQ